MGVRGPVVLPALVPVAIALGEAPKVGRTYSLPTLRSGDDDARASTRFTIDAESLFTLVDSATFDQDKGEWVERAHGHGARVAGAGTRRERTLSRGGSTRRGAWCRRSSRAASRCKRTALQLAFENWRIARDRATAAHAGTGDILERTAHRGRRDAGPDEAALDDGAARRAQPRRDTTSTADASISAGTR